MLEGGGRVGRRGVLRRKKGCSGDKMREECGGGKGCAGSS